MAETCRAAGCDLPIPVEHAEKMAKRGIDVIYCSRKCASRESSAALRARKRAEAGATAVIEIAAASKALNGRLDAYTYAGYDARRFDVPRLRESRRLYRRHRALFDRAVAAGDSFGWARILVTSTDDDVVVSVFDVVPRPVHDQQAEEAS